MFFCSFVSFQEIKGLNDRVELLLSKNGALDRQNRLLQRNLTDTIAKLNDTISKLRVSEQLVIETQKSAGGLIKALQEEVEQAKETNQELEERNKVLKDENQTVLALMGARTIEASKWRSEKRNLLGEKVRQVKELDTIRIKLTESENEYNILKQHHFKCLSEEGVAALEAKISEGELNDARHGKEKKLLEIEIAESHSALITLKTKFEGAERALAESNKVRNQSESLLTRAERETKILQASTEQMKNKMERAEEANVGLLDDAVRAQQEAAKVTGVVNVLVEEKKKFLDQLDSVTEDCKAQKQKILELNVEIKHLETFGGEKAKEVEMLAQLSEGMKERLKEANEKRLKTEDELRQVEVKLVMTEDSLEQMEVERKEFENDFEILKSLKQDKTELQDALERAQQDLSDQADKYRTESLKTDQLMAIERKR